MVNELPKKVQDLFNDPQAVKVLATISTNEPHIVPLGSMAAPTPDSIIFAKIMIKESHENLEKALKNGSHVAALAVKGPEAYQVRCKVKAFATSGPIYDAVGVKMKERNMPFSGVWILSPVDVIDQTPGPSAGKHW